MHGQWLGRGEYNNFKLKVNYFVFYTCDKKICNKLFSYKNKFSYFFQRY